MEEKKMTVFDHYMFAWSELNDELVLGRYHYSEKEKESIEDTMTYLSKRYMERAVSALRCGRKKDDKVLEFINNELLQRIMAFNEHLKRESEHEVTEQHNNE